VTTRRARLRLGIASAAFLVTIAGCADNPTPPPPSPTPPPAFGPVEVTGIGDLVAGGESPRTLVLRFSEPSNAAIGPGPGSLQLVLTDAAGGADALSFTGTPTLDAPGSLGVSAKLTVHNVFTISIVDSDAFNVEPITITGVGIKASSGAAPGPINLTVAACAGSLMGCTASATLQSPGTVVAP
jgi:hypothetical protein